MPVFGTHFQVTVVRAAGTPDELRWDTQMGGDADRNALFYIDDRIKTGDEIHGDFFDEPRIVTHVVPFITSSGVSHWEAKIVSQSEWKLRNKTHYSSIVMTGQGARVNQGSIDQSVQTFQTKESDPGITAALKEIRAAIDRSHLGAEEKNDSEVDVDQIESEMRRSRPDISRVWSLVDRLGSLVGLAEKVGKIIPLLEQYFGAR